MKASERDQLIYFQAPVIENNSGDVATTWADQSGAAPRAPDYAKVITQKGSEAFKSGHINASAVIRIGLNYREDVQTNWRIEWEGQFYNITAIDRSARRQGDLWITAECKDAS